MQRSRNKKYDPGAEHLRNRFREKKIVRLNASEKEINVRLTKVYSYIDILRINVSEK